MRLHDPKLSLLTATRTEGAKVGILETLVLYSISKTISYARIRAFIQKICSSRDIVAWTMTMFIKTSNSVIGIV